VELIRLFRPTCNYPSHYRRFRLENEKESYVPYLPAKLIDILSLPSKTQIGILEVYVQYLEDEIIRYRDVLGMFGELEGLMGVFAAVKGGALMDKWLLLVWTFEDEEECALRRLRQLRGIERKAGEEGGKGDSNFGVGTDASS
jgi:hypothetical protein